MISVFFVGQIRHKKYLEQFVLDILNNHFGIRNNKDIDIEIRCEKTLDHDAIGYCAGDNECITIELSRGYYHEGTYHRYQFFDLVETLAHELVHAKQNITQQASTLVEREREAYKLESVLTQQYWLSNYPCI